MGSDRAGDFLGTCVFAAVVSLLVSALAISMALNFSEWQWQREAIKRGFAEYDATTGDWKWKGEPK